MAYGLAFFGHGVFLGWRQAPPPRLNSTNQSDAALLRLGET